MRGTICGPRAPSWAILGLLSLASAVASANPLDLFGFGPRASGLAGACTAACADTSANYHNPAALAGVREVELTLGYTAASFDLRIDGEGQPVDGSLGALAGAVIPTDVMGLPVALGVGVFLPSGHLTRVRVHPAAKPRFALFDNKPQRLFVAANVAVEPAPGLQVGAGLAYMAATRGIVRLDGALVVPQEAGGTSLVSSLDVALKAIRYPSVGLRWSPSPGWTLGLVWRAEFALDLDLTTVIAGDLIQAFGDERLVLVEDAEFRLRSTNRVLFSPHQVVLGGAAEVLSGLRIVADVAWSQWSTFSSPVASVTPSLDLRPLVADATSLFPTRAPAPPPGFRDTWSIRGGAEVALGGGLTGRVGYAWEPTPAPEATGAMNLLDSDRQVFAVGASWELDAPVGALPGPVTFDLHAAHQRLAERSVTKTDPDDPYGDYSSEGQVWSGGAWVRARF